MLHRYQDLISLFDSGLGAKFNTRLIKGGDEPVYLPAGENCPYHQIIFARGYYASALHEIAHWCIAGQARRLLEDFGYWYLPDGRNEKQQKAFEQVEVKPQVVEWAFCVAANKRFNVSADNLNGAGADTMAFKVAVYRQVLEYLELGFPPRAQTFIDNLAGFYGVEIPLAAEDFTLDDHLQEIYQQQLAVEEEGQAV